MLIIPDMKKNDNSIQLRSMLFLFLSLSGFFLIENSSYSPANWSIIDNFRVGPNELGVPTPKSLFTKISSTEILNDTEKRISQNFEVPKGLESRVNFWIEIYSEYSSENKIIHHLDYPWIKYEVFNISDILARPARFNWINPEKAEKETEKKLQFVKSKIASLYKKLKKNISGQSPANYDPSSLGLDDEETKYFTMLKSIPGSLIKNIRSAMTRIRVQTGQKDFFQKGLQIANRYLPHMEQIFIDHGLPPEISRLPLVESSFDKAATSKVGAAGLWQFMNHTGKKFLVINSFIDERRSPLKSTEAAAELLKENYLIMGRSWPLAITAWNHGPAGLRKAVRTLNTKDFVNIITYFESKRFSFASENFYSEFLAALYVEKYSDKVFENISPVPTLIFTPYKLTQRIRPQKIFKNINITENDFVDFNPDLKKAVKLNLPLPKGLTIFIQPEKVQDLAKLENQKVARNEFTK